MPDKNGKEGVYTIIVPHFWLREVDGQFTWCAYKSSKEILATVKSREYPKEWSTYQTPFRK
jgi:hypothetical protein